MAPLRRCRRHPLPDIGPLVADQVGWPRYVAQVAAVYRDSGLRPTEVITSNYGEAGPSPLRPCTGGCRSCQRSQLAATVGHPPRPARWSWSSADQLDEVAGLFASCEVVDRLDNGLDVDNEEQGAPVAVCQ